jgi:hypothetical protein
MRALRSRRKVLLDERLENGVHGSNVYGAVVLVRIVRRRHDDARDEVIPARAAGEQSCGEQEDCYEYGF